MATITNIDWLSAIDNHQDSTITDLLAAYHHLGAKTDLTRDQVDESTVHLQLLGFLRPIAISADDRDYTYELRIPRTGAA